MNKKKMVCWFACCLKVHWNRWTTDMVIGQLKFTFQNPFLMKILCYFGRWFSLLSAYTVQLFFRLQMFVVVVVVSQSLQAKFLSFFFIFSNFFNRKSAWLIKFIQWVCVCVFNIQNINVRIAHFDIFESF